MSEASEPRPTSVADIALPVVLVTLKDLKTRSGAAVVVRCDRPSELALLASFKSMPGHEPPQLQAPDPPSDEESKRARAMARLEELERIAPGLIESATSLDDGAGGFVRPAFWFDPAKPRSPLSIDGRVLSAEDKSLLMDGIARAGGYGGAAESGDFSGDDGSRADAGLGSPPAGEE